MAEDSSTKAALRRVAAELTAFYNELSGDNARAAAILAVASLENELGLLIREKFPDDLSNTLWNKIAGPGFTPLGSLSARANIAQAFGFYGPQTRSLIERISAVRNKFAHKSYVRGFEHPLIMEQCIKLSKNHVFPDGRVTKDSSPTHVRWVYLQTVQNLEEHLFNIRNYIPELGSKIDPLP